MSYNSGYTGEQLDEAILNRHEQNTDTFLDLGGSNQVSASDIRSAVDTIGRDVVVGALDGHHSVPAVADSAGESVILTPTLTLKNNTKYTVEIFMQLSSASAGISLSTADSNISHGILYSPDDSVNNYSGFSTLVSVDTSGGDKLEARYLNGIIQTGTSPSIRFSYVYDVNGFSASFYHFYAKLTEIYTAEEQ